MITHEEAVRMCEILDQRRRDKARKKQYDAVSFQIDSITRTKKRLSLKHGLCKNYISY